MGLVSHVRRPLSADLRAEAARPLLGEHDFSSFRAAGCGAHTPNRRIDRIEVGRDGDLVHIDVWGNAFLRNMVRIVAGTLVEAGRGKRDAQSISEVLQARDRRLAGQTAPPQGLFLVEVLYS